MISLLADGLFEMYIISCWQINEYIVKILCSDPLNLCHTHKHRLLVVLRVCFLGSVLQ